MKPRFLLFRRGRVFYCEDQESRRQISLRTRDQAAAQSLVNARNEAVRQPQLNLRIAQTYLAASDPLVAQRTWADVMRAFVELKAGSNRARYDRAVSQRAFDQIRDRRIIDTQAEHFLATLRAGSVSTHIHLRRFHNFALGMNWLAWPVLPRKLWPSVSHRERRAITREEHERIIAGESNAELRDFYAACWHLGGSQTDVARLRAEDVDWPHQVVSFRRAKTKTMQIVHFGAGLAEVLRRLPGTGLLFPRLASMDEKHRAALFQRACRRERIRGISLHSYRYAWAERAKCVGLPERFAQEALGHNSKAVHRTYARKAQVRIPSLEALEELVEKSPPGVIERRAGDALMNRTRSHVDNP